jgi:hypothetical protein
MLSTIDEVGEWFFELEWSRNGVELMFEEISWERDGRTKGLAAKIHEEDRCDELIDNLVSEWHLEKASEQTTSFYIGVLSKDFKEWVECKITSIELCKRALEGTRLYEAYKVKHIV